MSDFQIDFSWFEPANSADRRSFATMAELKIIIDGKPVTEVLDRGARSYRNSVYVPLFPVVEWLISNWWFIWNESDVEGRPFPRPDYGMRHDLRFAGDGFFLPSIVFSPAGERIRVQVQPWKGTSGRVEFLADAIHYTSRVNLESQFRGLIDATLSRLDDYGIDSSFLQTEWNTVNQLEATEVEFHKIENHQLLSKF